MRCWFWATRTQAPMFSAAARPSHSHPVGSFVSVVSPSLAVALASLGAYEGLRHVLRFVYYPRLEWGHTPARAQRVPLGVLGWVFEVYKMSENDFVANAGVDAAVFLRMLALGSLRSGAPRRAVAGASAYSHSSGSLLFSGTKLFIIMSIVAMTILFPVNSAGGGESTGFDVFNLSNVRDGSHLLWAHVAVCYMFTGLVIFTLNSEYDEVAAGSRTSRASSRPPDNGPADEQVIRLVTDFKTSPAEHRMVYVRLIPERFRTDEGLYAYFDRIYPHQVKA
jgi:hypothetical protein